MRASELFVSPTQPPAFRACRPPAHFGVCVRSHISCPPLSLRPQSKLSVPDPFLLLVALVLQDRKRRPEDEAAVVSAAPAAPAPAPAAAGSVVPYISSAGTRQPAPVLSRGAGFCRTPVLTSSDLMLLPPQVLSTPALPRFVSPAKRRCGNCPIVLRARYPLTTTPSTHVATSHPRGNLERAWRASSNRANATPLVVAATGTRNTTRATLRRATTKHTDRARDAPRHTCDPPRHDTTRPTTIDSTCRAQQTPPPSRRHAARIYGWILRIFTIHRCTTCLRAPATYGAAAPARPAVLKLLVNNNDAGHIIGKRGATVNELQVC